MERVVFEAGLVFSIERGKEVSLQGGLWEDGEMRVA